MTMYELDKSQFQIQGVLPGHRLVLNRVAIHQLIGCPFQSNARQGGACACCEGGGMEGQVAWYKGADVLG